MAHPGILVVDDEKNIRLTMIQDLAPLGYEISCAMNGEDALKQLEEKEFGLILLDLKMPGINGMEVLRQVVNLRPDIRVIIVSAYGGIEKVVEAIKLGAVDFIRKPFTPQEIRDSVSRVMDREKVEAAQATDYAAHLALVRRCMSEHHFEAAIEHAKKAISLYPSRPEAFNLLGLVQEMLGHHEEAMKHYRVALDLDPAYEPAWQNMKLSQNTSHMFDVLRLD
jgi:DNA-binding NtrC family response regulator